MKKIYLLAVAMLCLVACGDGVDLPSAGVETDLSKIPLPGGDEVDMEIPLKDESTPMIHCGGLHTEEDFERVRTNLHISPWKEGFELLEKSGYAQVSYNPSPVETIIRGVSGDNYMNAARGAAAAYQLGLRWKITGEVKYAERAVYVLNQWAYTCTGVTGNSNSSLASGIYGHEFAVAGELLRDYEGWDEADFKNYQEWMLNVFLPGNKDFLERHHGTPNGHYWANWGLCNLASVIAIGILTDRRDIYNYGIEHLQRGLTNGNINKAIYHVFDGENSNLAQWQESNRDAGHTYMCQGLLGTICQLTWNQGDDFFGYKDNMFLKACEYTAKYHIAGMDVPNLSYTREYRTSWGVDYEEYPTIAERQAMTRPIWALPYYHYSKMKGVDAERYKYSAMGMSYCFPEGGGGNYGETSGGFDVLGFGTLMYAR